VSDMVEVEVPVVDDASVEPVYAGDDYNVFVSDEAATPDEATTKLLAELQAKQAELQRAQSAVDPVNAMRQGIEALGERISPRQPADARLQNQQIDLKKLEEDFNKSVYDNPFQKTAELFQLFSQMTGTQQANANLMYSQRILQVDPATKDLYKRFKSEVDEEVARLPAAERATNPGVYDDALTRVKARHMEELFQERLDEAMKKPPVAATAPSPRAYAEGGGVRPSVAIPPNATRKVVVSTSKMREVEQFAGEKMIPVSAALSYFERHGMLK